MRQRHADLIIFLPMGSVLGAILMDAGLSIWLVPLAAVVVAVSLVYSDVAMDKLKERPHGKAQP
jgi:hypothetical protein